MNNFLNINEIAQKNLNAILDDAIKIKEVTLKDDFPESVIAAVSIIPLLDYYLKSYRPERVSLLKLPY